MYNLPIYVANIFNKFFLLSFFFFYSIFFICCCSHMKSELSVCVWYDVRQVWASMMVCAAAAYDSVFLHMYCIRVFVHIFFSLLYIFFLLLYYFYIAPITFNCWCISTTFWCKQTVIIFQTVCSLSLYPSASARFPMPHSQNIYYTIETIYNKQQKEIVIG